MIAVETREEWRTDHHIDGYEVSNTGKVRTRSGKMVPVHGTGAKAFVKLSDRKGRQRQKNLWQLVRQLHGHNPVLLPGPTEPAPAPEPTAAEPVVQSHPEPAEPEPSVRWADVVEDGVEAGYRISDLGEVLSPTGELLNGSTVKSQSGNPWFNRRIILFKRPADSDYVGNKQIRLDVLVAKYFLEPAPLASYDLEHINGDWTDCRAVNLRWAPRPPVTRHPATPRKRGIDVMVRRMVEKMEKLDNWAMVITPKVAHKKYWVSREGAVMGVHDRELTQFLYENGHVGVNVKSAQNGKSTSVRVDRLVLEAFGHPRPSRSHQVVHRNGDFTDCRLDNLCWSTTGTPVEEPTPTPAAPTPAAPTPVSGDEVQVSILARYSYAGISVLVNDDEIVEVPGTTLENAGALAKILDRIAQDRQ